MSIAESKHEALRGAAAPVSVRGGARRAGRWMALASLVFASLWVASGVYLVDADERGVVRRFGAVVQQVGPGMHYRLPWPIDRVVVVKTTAVMKAGVGFALPESGGEAPAGVELLTGDTNIVSLALVLHYVITDPASFLFAVEEPRRYVDTIAQGVLSETVLGMAVDEVLTTGRLAVQDAVRRRTQALLDEYGSGIRITAASIMSMTLDRTVASAFQDVADAAADREKMSNEARSYANAILPKARGDARVLIAEAQSYRRQRVAEALGSAERFGALLVEHEKAPEVSRTRLYLETIEKLLPRAKTFVIDTQDGRAAINLRLTPP